MANTYVAPNFDIDTTTTLDGLIALKGAPIGVADMAAVYNNATLSEGAQVTWPGRGIIMGCNKLNTVFSAGFLNIQTPGFAFNFAGNAAPNNIGGNVDGIVHAWGVAGSGTTLIGSDANRITLNRTANYYMWDTRWGNMNIQNVNMANTQPLPGGVMFGRIIIGTPYNSGAIQIWNKVRIEAWHNYTQTMQVYLVDGTKTIIFNVETNHPAAGATFYPIGWNFDCAAPTAVYAKGGITVKMIDTNRYTATRIACDWGNANVNAGILLSDRSCIGFRKRDGM